MTHIFVVNPKGGCGKTTIATHLAEYHANKGFQVLLVDHDEQRSCSDWYSARPTKLRHNGLQLMKKGGAYEQTEYDLIVHDMPAGFGILNAKHRISEGDKVLIPVLPSPTDIRACLRFFMALHRTGFSEQKVDIGFIANRVKTNTKYAEVLMEFLTRLQFPLLTTLRDSQNYLRAMNEGLTLFDLPKHLVRQDLNQWAPILKWVEPTLHLHEELA